MVSSFSFGPETLLLIASSNLLASLKLGSDGKCRSPDSGRYMTKLCHGACMQDVANALEQTLDLPSILPHGARVDPTTDGFLLWLPSSMSLPVSTTQTSPSSALVDCSFHESLCYKSRTAGDGFNAGTSLPCCESRQLDVSLAHGKRRISGHALCSGLQSVSW